MGVHFDPHRRKYLIEIQIEIQIEIEEEAANRGRNDAVILASAEEVAVLQKFIRRAGIEGIDFDDDFDFDFDFGFGFTGKKGNDRRAVMLSRIGGRGYRGVENIGF